jgi:hypothetical protein
MLTEPKKEQNLSDSYCVLIKMKTNVDEETELLDHKTYQKTIGQAVRDEKIAPHLKSSWYDVEDKMLDLFNNTGQLQNYIEDVKTSLSTRTQMEGENEEKMLRIQNRRICIGSSLTLICLGAAVASGWALSRCGDADSSITNGYTYCFGGTFGMIFSIMFTGISATLLSKHTTSSQRLEPCLEPGVKPAVTRKYDKQFLYSFFNTPSEYGSLQLLPSEKISNRSL